MWTRCTPRGEPCIRLRLANSDAEDPEDGVPPTATRMTRRNDWRRRTPFDRRARRVRCFVQPLKRVVAIGDLHGDLNKATRAFRAGGLIDSHGKWIGGATVAVQVGDQLDRGGDEVAILYMLERLRKEARDAGGELIVMNGNHETLNVAGRFRYAFEPGIEDFRRWRGRQLLGAAMKAKCGEKPGGCAIVGAAAAAAAIDRKAEKNGEPRIESRGRSGNAPPPGSAPGRMYADTGPGSTMPRLAALAPGGPMAKRFLAHQPVVVAVGSTLFAHGGVLPHHVQYGLERINQETSEWIRGDAKPGPPPVHVSGGRWCGRGTTRGRSGTSATAGCFGKRWTAFPDRPRGRGSHDPATRGC